MGICHIWHGTAHNCVLLSYRRTRRYSVCRLKRLEARDLSHVRFTQIQKKLSLHLEKIPEREQNFWNKYLDQLEHFHYEEGQRAYLFAKDGYEAVSVSRIAGTLGMTKGTLYRYYENES